MSGSNGNTKEAFLNRLNKAKDLYQKEEWEAAAILYHQLIDESPANDFSPFELWVELAWVYDHLGRYESTIICLKQVIEKNPQYHGISDVFRLTAQSQRKLGRSKKAIENLLASLDHLESDSEKSFEIQYEIAQVHFERGEYSSAKEYFAAIQEHFEYGDNDTLLANFYYTYAFSEFYLQNFVEAERLFEDMWRIAPTDQLKTLALYGKSFIFFNDNRHEALIEIVEQIFKLDPEFSDKETMAYFLCVSYKAINDRAKFEMFFQQLKQNYPEGKYAEHYDGLEQW